MTEDKELEAAAREHATDSRLVIPFTALKYDSFKAGARWAEERSDLAFKALYGSKTALKARLKDRMRKLEAAAVAAKAVTDEYYPERMQVLRKALDVLDEGESSKSHSS